MLIHYLEANIKKVKVNEKYLGHGIQTFLHLSKSPELTLENIKCPPSEAGVFVDKPQRSGFWAAPNAGWSKYVAVNKDINKDRYLYKIKLDLSNILIPKKTPLKDINPDIKTKHITPEGFYYYDWDDVQKKLGIDGIWFLPPVPNSWSIVNESVYLFNKNAIKQVTFIGDFINALKNKSEK
jgi:hypothetical protein